MMQNKQTCSNLKASNDENEAIDTENDTENPNFNESNEIENEGIASLVDRRGIS